MKITPNDLNSWASELVARSELPVLLRKLVHGRSVTLAHVEFPAYESTNDGGWDGQAQANGVDPWIPQGQSFWELSCRATAKLPAKAKEDINKRTDETDEVTRLASTFVFATPRRWPGKAAWAKVENAKGRWREVRVYDADTLSEWIEQTPAAQAFIASQLGRPVSDLTSLEQFWTEWSGVTKPRLPPAVFDEAFAENRTRIDRFLADKAPDPLTVTGETRLEAAAFAACALLHFDLPAEARNRAVVLSSAAGVQLIRTHPERLILLVATPEAEGALGDLAYNHHVILPADRSGADKNPGPSVEPLKWDAYRQVAEAMELDKDAMDRLERDSGRRVALMRRQLSTVPQIRQPIWASNDAAAKALIALAFGGGWNFKTEGDRTLLAALGDTTVEEIEASITMLTGLPEAPIFSIGGVGGIVSRADAFWALRSRITKTHLVRFFATARQLLEEPDPTRELEPEKRWMANIYGKERGYSATMRKQLADTLTFLAVHGDALLSADFNCEQAASKLIRDLFGSMEDAWLDLNDVLQPLAEAAPDVFLDAIEADLPHETEDRGVWKAIKPADTSGFASHSDRTQLAWAFERLLWAPLRFPRAARALAALSTRKLTDNLVNKPSESLFASMHPWLPQTAAPLATRVAVLRSIDQLYPSAAWDLALALVDQRMSHADYSQRPRFREDAVGAGVKPAWERGIMVEAQSILLARTDCDRAQVISLIERVPCFSVTGEKKLWLLVERWAEAAAPEDIGFVRETLRRYGVGGRRSRRRIASPRARALFEALQPKGLHTHAWLFRGWVEFSNEELEDEDVAARSLETRDARIANARAQALAQVWDESGLDGVIALAGVVDEPWIVGSMLPATVKGLDARTVLGSTLASKLKLEDQLSLMGGLLFRLDVAERTAVLTALFDDSDDIGRTLNLLLAAPLEDAVWTLVDRLAPGDQVQYWKRINRRAFDLLAESKTRLLRELLAVQRAQTAFQHLYLEAEKVPTEIIVEVLRATAFAPGEENGPKISWYEVERCFEVLDERPDCSTDDLATLEYAYANALNDSKRGLKALTKILSLSPETFAVGIGAIYRDVRIPRDDTREIDAGAQQRGELWHRIFSKISYGPGGSEIGEVDLATFDEWMPRTIALLEESGRLESGLHTIGVIIGRTRIEIDGQWPPRAYAAMLEKWGHEELTKGIYYGVVNSRGAQWRDGNGGAAERDLAQKYRGWSETCIVDFPKLAACFEGVARHYEHDAKWHDERARLERTSNQ